MGRPRKRRLVEEGEADGGEGIGEGFADLNGDSTVATQVIRVDDKQTLQHYVPIDSIEPFPLGYTSASGQYFQPQELPLDDSLAFLDQSPAASGPGLYNLPSQDPSNLLYTQTSHDGLDPAITIANSSDFPQSISDTLEGGMDILDGLDFDETLHHSLFGTSKDISRSLQSYIATPTPPERRSTIKSAPSVSTLSEHITISTKTASASTSATSENGSPSAFKTSTPDSPTPVMKPLHTVVCSCLSSLYLSLDALARLPTEVHSAMRVTRNATKVAHDIVLCTKCSLPLLDDPTSEPSMQALQNLMLLGALLPSACNAYAQILEMIEEMTATAKKEHRNIYFTFNQVGGLWGHAVQDHSRPGSVVVSGLDDTDLEPDVWRATMRAILRLDIYGFSQEDEVGKDPEEEAEILQRRRHQLGLKDVVRLLDSRHARRHDQMDAAYARGEAMEMPTGILFHGGPYKPIPPEQRNCVKILEPARIALNNLVIR